MDDQNGDDGHNDRVDKLTASDLQGQEILLSTVNVLIFHRVDLRKYCLDDDVDAGNDESQSNIVAEVQWLCVLGI